MRSTLTRYLVATVLMAAAAAACTVPVFRYALDHWPGDAYRLEAPAGWAETGAGEALLKLLEESQTSLDLVELAEAGGPARFLMPGEESEVIWSGELDESATALFVSPAREELVRRILAGESMVWVMVTSGDADQDRTFEERMKKRLDYLGTVATIPEQDPNDPESQLGVGPSLRVGFSFMMVDREDAVEQVFLKMLAGPGGGELLDGEEPFAAVVFGRGRVLGAWTGTDLDDEGIDEVSLFLLGACSCRVKVQNPGWDLAMAVNWEARLLASQMAADEELEESDAAPSEATPVSKLEVVSFDGGGMEEKVPPAKSAGVGFVLIGIIAAAVVVLAGVAFGSRKGH